MREARIRRRLSLALLNASALLVVVGGLYDVLTPGVPAHELEFLRSMGEQPEPASVTLYRELLRALGGALIGVGISLFALVNLPFRRGERWAAWTVSVVICVSEGINAVGMARVGGPFWAPLTFVFLALLGIAIAYIPFPAFEQDS
jgi:hypothetical protein